MTAPNPVVRVGRVEIGNAKPLSLIAGPCALESRDHALEMASALKEVAAKAGMGLVYKTSFDKANRTSANSARGLGLELQEIRETLEKRPLPRTVTTQLGRFDEGTMGAFRLEIQGIVNGRPLLVVDHVYPVSAAVVATRAETPNVVVPPGPF